MEGSSKDESRENPQIQLLTALPSISVAGWWRWMRDGGGGLKLMVVSSKDESGEIPQIQLLTALPSSGGGGRGMAAFGQNSWKGRRRINPWKIPRFNF